MKICMLYALLATSMVAMSSCSDDEQSIVAQSENQLSIDVELEHVETRAVIERTSFINDDALGLYVLNADGGMYDAAYGNIKATLMSAKWTITPAAIIGTKPATVCAYYPYSQQSPASLTDGAPAISIEIGNTDYLWGKCDGITSSQSNAKLTMRHALTCIRFALTQESCIEGCRLEKIAVKGSAVGTSATLNLTDGSLSGVAHDPAGVSQSYTDKPSFLSAEVRKDILLCPMTLSAANAGFIFTIDGQDYEVHKDGVELKAGYMYTFPVKYVGRKGLEIGDPEVTSSGLIITDWQTGGNSSSYNGWN